MSVRTLLIAAALLGGTAQAAESTDLCGANLQKLDDILAVRGKTSVTGARVTEVKELQAKARQDQASGDTKGCITATTQALQILQNAGKKWSATDARRITASGYPPYADATLRRRYPPILPPRPRPISLIRSAGFPVPRGFPPGWRRRPRPGRHRTANRPRSCRPR